MSGGVMTNYFDIQSSDGMMGVVDDGEDDSTQANDASHLLLALIRKFYCGFMQITSPVSAH